MKQDQGKIFYELRLKGLNNHQIAERFGVKPQKVAVQLLKYRKKNKLPSLKPLKKSNKKVVIYDDEQIRKENHKKAFRRKDGVLQCPTKYCEGFDFNDISFKQAL